MKKFLAMMSFVLVSASAFAAEGFELPRGSMELIPIRGEVTRIGSMCPPNAMCITDGTVIDLSFRLGGCLDRLAPLTYKAIEKDDVLHVFVSALRVSNEGSR